jgi:hypothetical protein
MKAVPILFLIFGAAITFACDHYDFCHCQNSDLSADDAATKAVCAFTSQDYGGGTQETVMGYVECEYSAGSYDPAISDNCMWADFCKIVGATGPDSDCRNV